MFVAIKTDSMKDENIHYVLLFAVLKHAISNYYDLKHVNRRATYICRFRKRYI